MRYSWRKYGYVVILLGLWGCGSNLEKSLAPDPRLSQQPVDLGQKQTTQKLPQDFPAEIPLYPDAKLMQSQAGSTVWAIADDVTKLEQFYQKTLKEKSWQILPPDNAASPQIRQLIAQKNNLEITLSFPKTTAPAAETSARAVVGTTFVLNYRQLDPEPQLNSATPPDTSNPETPEAPPSKLTEPQPTEQPSTIADLVALGVVSENEFQPDAVISRRQFARWLFIAHNNIYGDRQNQQIRLAASSSKPVFTDVPSSDPDFAMIQGLAEAGLIPSSLTNDTVTTFRPDAPLTRETLIAWKVPLDRRQALPKTSLDNIAETWGFQDTTQIETRAIQALYVDFQNGDKSNVRRIFGYTTLFQPKKNVTQQEAAIALWYFGYQGDGFSAADALKTPTPPQKNSPTN